MKILKLRFKNLNSLYGEWCVDFSHPQYAADGIFAITGPTGAGKSTVLDALCLALYARTPRLNTVTKGGNEIMSRRTGECFSEVTFETPQGRFCCHWSQRRAYKKADGNLTDSKHEISDAVSGKILETKKREVAARIEGETGMDFDRFTRSMLLAQGGFAAFLAASPDDRSPILEQITGTGIYSEISMAVHQRLKDENQARETLKAETAGIPILESQEKEDLEKRLENREAQRVELAAKVDKQAEALAWKKQIQSLETELVRLEEEGENLARETVEFKAHETELEWARKARELAADFEILKSGRDKRDQDARLLRQARESLPAVKARLESRTADGDKAASLVKALETDQKAVREELNGVRAMDLKLGEKKKAVAQARTEVARHKAALEAREKEMIQAKKDQERLNIILKDAQAFLDSHSRDQGLATAMAGIEARVGELSQIAGQRQAMQGDWKQLNTSLKNAAKAAEKAQARCSRLEKEEDALVARIEVLEKKRDARLNGKLLREYRAEKESRLRELGYIKKIQSLEEERKKLSQGTACPLCGSLDHPFREHDLPEPDAAETRLTALDKIINEVEALEHQIQGLELKGKQQARERTLADREAAQAASDKALARQRMDQCEAKGREVKVRLDELVKELSGVLAPFGETVDSQADLAGICPNLKRRWAVWEAKDKERDKVQRELEGITTDIRHLHRTLEDQVELLRERRRNLEGLEKETNDLSMERRRRFGDKEPDAEEARIQSGVDQARAVLEEARKLVSQAKEEQDACDERIRTLTLTSAKELERVGELSKAFNEKLVETGFRDEADFLRRRMAEERLKALELQAQTLADRGKELAAKTADRKEKLKTEKARKLTTQSLEDLETKSARLRKDLDRLAEEIGGMNQRLADNREAEAKLASVMEKIQAQETECRRWEDLHALIGSADGKKFRNFAQGLTFEQVVTQANQQLIRMSDRYLLVRDTAEPLALNIIDQYQAGEVRSTKNLSGGESFIVSLSLALGLSRMAGGKVRVDSLFLDEGFGTLDEEALETALDALSGLHREGKTIGVISHIPALKERIGTQILIEPGSGGKSRLSGPGVSRSDS